jgi:GntR family transcriptional repressor for pyruvate dehydrogenase complex
MGPDAIMNLLAARLLIEPAVAELAAINATDRHLAELADLLADAERHLSGQDAEDTVLGVANMRFHRCIADGAGNPILAEVVFTLTEVHIKEQMAVLDLYNNRRRDHEQHKRIFDALHKRDAGGARALMSDHLTDVITVVRGKLNGGDAAA